MTLKGLVQVDLPSRRWWVGVGVNHFSRLGMQWYPCVTAGPIVAATACLTVVRWGGGGQRSLPAALALNAPSWDTPHSR